MENTKYSFSSNAQKGDLSLWISFNKVISEGVYQFDVFAISIYSRSAFKCGEIVINKRSDTTLTNFIDDINGNKEVVNRLSENAMEYLKQLHKVSV